MDIQTELQQILDQEKELQFPAFTNEDAWELGSLLVDSAKNRSLAITIDISRCNQQLFHCAMPGSTVDNDEWIKRKNRLVGRVFHSSYYINCLLKQQNTTIEKSMLLSEFEYAPHGGAFPLIVEGVGVVGTITVSGLPQKDDHEFVVSVLREYFVRAGK